MANTTANVTEIELTDGRRVCLSYGVIVAAFIPADYGCSRDTANPAPYGYLRTNARYSVTTSKHMNQFAGRDSAIVPDAVLKALCAPVASK